MTTDGSVYITAGNLCARYDNISEMTLWRWQRNPAFGFPRPFAIGQRKYWKLAEILEWEEKQKARPYVPRPSPRKRRAAETPEAVGPSPTLSLDAHVDYLELSCRAANCLHNANIETIGALLKLPRKQLLNTPNFGRRSLAEIEERLSKHGLAFPDPDEGTSRRLANAAQAWLDKKAKKRADLENMCERALRMILEGKTYKAVAEDLGVTLEVARNRFSKAVHIFGRESRADHPLHEAAKVYWDR